MVLVVQRRVDSVSFVGQRVQSKLDRDLVEHHIRGLHGVER